MVGTGLTDLPRRGGLELGEFSGAGPVLGGQLSEAPLDALPVLLVGLGIAGVVLLFKLVMRFFRRRSISLISVCSRA